VTTHTEFDIQSEDTGREIDFPERQPLLYDFQQAERKIAPPLSALVSGADYLFDLSPTLHRQKVVCLLTPRAAVGGDVAGVSYIWDKDRLRLEELTPSQQELAKLKPRDEGQLANLIGSQLVRAIGAIARSALR